MLAGTLISYLGLLYTRSNPGFSFGNRYLVPQIVLVLFFTQFYFENAENLAFFRLFFWTAFAMMAPGLMAPLRIPNPLFLQANLVLSLSVLALHAVTVLIPALRTAPEKLLGFFSRRPWAAILLMAVLLRIEMSIYVGTAVF